MILMEDITVIYLYVFLYMLTLGFIIDRYLKVENVDNRELVLKEKVVYIPMIILLMLPAFLLAALRSDVGTDYTVYLTKQIPEVLNGWNGEVEPLYRLIIKISGFMNNLQLIFGITHFIILLFIILAIKEKHESFFLSIVVLFGTGFFNYSLNIMRQSIAMAIFVYAIQFIDNNKKKYVILIILAALFHKSALLYLFIPFIKDISIRFIPAIVSLVVTLLIRNPIRSLLMWLTAKMGLYNQYFGSIIDLQKTGWVFLVINSLILITMLIASTLNHLNHNKLAQRYIFFQYITTFVTVLSSILPNYERLMYMFMIVQIISIPFFYRTMKFKYKLILFLVVSSLYITLFYRLFIVSNIGDTFPYQSIFQ